MILRPWKIRERPSRTEVYEEIWAAGTVDCCLWNNNVNIEEAAGDSGGINEDSINYATEYWPEEDWKEIINGKKDEC